MNVGDGFVAQSGRSRLHSSLCRTATLAESSVNMFASFDRNAHFSMKQKYVKRGPGLGGRYHNKRCGIHFEIEHYRDC